MRAVERPQRVAEADLSQHFSHVGPKLELLYPSRRYA